MEFLGIVLMFAVIGGTIWAVIHSILAYLKYKQAYKQQGLQVREQEIVLLSKQCEDHFIKALQDFQRGVNTSAENLLKLVEELQVRLNKIEDVIVYTNSSQGTGE